MNSNSFPRSSGLIPGWGRSPGEGTLQYSCLENPIDRGAWWATVYGVRHNLATKPPTIMNSAAVHAVYIFPWVYEHIPGSSIPRRGMDEPHRMLQAALLNIMFSNRFLSAVHECSSTSKYQYMVFSILLLYLPHDEYILLPFYDKNKSIWPCWVLVTAHGVFCCGARAL